MHSVLPPMHILVLTAQCAVCCGLRANTKHLRGYDLNLWPNGSAMRVCPS